MKSLISSTIYLLAWYGFDPSPLFLPENLVYIADNQYFLY